MGAPAPAPEILARTRKGLAQKATRVARIEFPHTPAQGAGRLGRSRAPPRAAAAQGAPLALNRTRSPDAPPGGVVTLIPRSDAVLAVTSQLESRWHAVLERLLFFNDQQHMVRAHVAAAIEAYGALQILDEQGTLRLKLERSPDAQTLYCVLPDGRPVGCLVYLRDAPDRFLVLHVAVEPAFSARGQLADGDVLLKLVGAVRAAARRTRGVQRVDLLYAADRTMRGRMRAAADGAGG